MEARLYYMKNIFKILSLSILGIILLYIIILCEATVYLEPNKRDNDYDDDIYNNDNILD